MNQIQVPADLGRIPRKIDCGEGFTNFTADQWRTFFTIYATTTGLMMADRHPTGCRSPSLLCNGKMPIGEYWTISLYADWEKLMAAIGINSPPIEWTIGINF